MANLFIYGIVGCILLWPALFILGWIFKILGGIIEFVSTRQQRKEWREKEARSKALDREVKQACGNDWIAGLGYRIKKSLYEMREIQNKTNPEQFYRDEDGNLQEVKVEEKEHTIELKTKEFKCPNCGAPLNSVTEKMTATCSYCNIQVAFLKN